MSDRVNAIERRFGEWSEGGTLPSPQHADDVTWLIAEVRKLRLLEQGNRVLVGERDQRIRALMGQVESLEALLAS